MTTIPESLLKLKLPGTNLVSVVVDVVVVPMVVVVIVVVDVDVVVVGGVGTGVGTGVGAGVGTGVGARVQPPQSNFVVVVVVVVVSANTNAPSSIFHKAATTIKNANMKKEPSGGSHLVRAQPGISLLALAFPLEAAGAAFFCRLF